MAELKVLQAPEKKVQDKKGRAIVVREPAWDTEQDFALVVGAEAAENRAWMRQQFPYLWVASIDGEEVDPPETMREFKALRKQLGREGYEAALEAVDELLSEQDQTAKNSQGTPASESA